MTDAQEIQRLKDLIVGSTRQSERREAVEQLTALYESKLKEIKDKLEMAQLYS